MEIKRQMIQPGADRLGEHLVALLVVYV